MRTRSLTLAAAIALSATGPARADEPLMELARSLPAAAIGSEVMLIDFDAARREIPQAEGLGGWIEPYYGVLTQQFDLVALPFMVGKGEDWLREELGFSLTEIGQLAEWDANDPPQAKLILRGAPALAEPKGVGAALAARGYEVRAVVGQDIWHRFEDGQIDDAAGLETPFDGSLGISTRFAIRAGDKAFLATNTWPAMEELLAGSGQFLDGPGNAALLAAASAPSEPGSLIQIMFPAGPLMRRGDFDPSMIIGQAASAETIRQIQDTFNTQAKAVPAPPQSLAYAFWNRREGVRSFGFIGLAYQTREDAELALERVKLGIETAQSLTEAMPFDELLPAKRNFEVFDTGEGAFVAVIRFEAPQPDGEISGLGWMPRAYMLLVDLNIRRDLLFLATE